MGRGRERMGGERGVGKGREGMGGEGKGERGREKGGRESDRIPCYKCNLYGIEGKVQYFIKMVKFMTHLLPVAPKALSTNSWRCTFYIHTK